MLMKNDLEIKVIEIVNKHSAWYFKSVHQKLMPAFKNLSVKVLNKKQGKITLPSSIE